MKRHLQKWCGCIAALGIAVVLVLAGSVSPVLAGKTIPAPATDELGVILPDQEVEGMTYAEWSAAWWQWVLSVPWEQSPFNDNDSCQNGDNGQAGPVWFLVGGLNDSETSTRNCYVPVGKYLFLPVVNSECSTVESFPWYGKNKKELIECVNMFEYIDMFAGIEGDAVAELASYFVESDMFKFEVPENNMLGVDPGQGKAATTGYYLMLEPLGEGEVREVCFGGIVPNIPDPAGGDPFDFTLDICYTLTGVAAP